MEDKDKKGPKSVWTDISKTWGRIAAVIAAVGGSATFVVKVFHTSSELTYSVFAALGIMLLIISFYVDKQSAYLHDEIIAYEQQARKDFIKAIHKDRDQMTQIKVESNNKITQLNSNIDKILEASNETRKDTVRIQLLMVLSHQPENIDTIFRLAEKYFVQLEGDWYMTNEFVKWAKDRNIIIPPNIFNSLDISKYIDKENK